MGNDILWDDIFTKFFMIFLENWWVDDKKC